MSHAVHFLEGTGPLAGQVADFLLEGGEGEPFDLGDTEVWVPTAGAARRIRFELARRAGARGRGVLSPRFVQPMQALLPAEFSGRVATRVECEAVWAWVLREADPTGLEPLFPRREVLAGDAALLGAGSVLCDLCDALAEGGFAPGDPVLGESPEPERWEAVARLYRCYLDRLAGCGLSDPNRLRLGPPGVVGRASRLVIACIPDLAPVAARRAERLAADGVAVTVLVWKPGAMAGGFDAWGRPLSAEWGGVRIPLADDQIRMTHDAADEAVRALDDLAAAPVPGDYALVLVDPGLVPAFVAEILERGVKPFVPEGEPLIHSEPAVFALGWMEGAGGGSLRMWRRLLELPAFARWMGRETGLAPTQLLAACDCLLAEVFVEDLEQAESWANREGAGDDTAAAGRDGEACERALRLVRAMRRVSGWSVGRLLNALWRGGAPGWDAARQVAEIHEAILHSPVFAGWEAGQSAAFARALRSATLFAASAHGDLELHGWLEAPWLEAGRLALCGCVEGRLPSAPVEHAFLPDSLRGRLGLPSRADRLARDLYLMWCLIQSRPSGGLRCSYPKFGADGAPSLPSNLLLRPEAAHLPGRVSRLFRESDGGRRRPRRGNGWRWELRGEQRVAPPAHVSATDFAAYLRCPFRFYFSRVLRLEPFDARAREMDALRFGSLLHAVLEHYAREARDEEREDRIEAIVLDQLRAESRQWFGPEPAPAVRVQLRAIEVRLRAFARVQAAEFARGWRILEAERKLRFDEAEPLTVGGLRVSARVDRVDEHPEEGIRVLDYKTFANADPPAKKHWGPAGSVEPVVPEAEVEVGGKRRRWIDLQLPLYRAVAARWYPGRMVRAGYLMLPADPEGTAVAMLHLDEALQESAMRCAATVAERIRLGRFWPPQPASREDPFNLLFLNGSPECSLGPQTIEFLKGGA